MRLYLPILFNFIKMKILFKKDGRRIELRGIIEEAKLREIIVNKVYKNLKKTFYGFVR